MVRSGRVAPLLLVAFALLPPGPAAAAHFDLVHVSRMDVTLCTNGCGITLAGMDFALFVNQGALPVAGSEFFATTFEAVSSEPTIRLRPFVNDPGGIVVAPILPHEAVGSTFSANALLAAALEPGETYRNTFPGQVLAFQLARLSGAYEGPVRFDVTMQTGEETARFRIDAELRVGRSGAIAFRTAGRATSFDPVVDARVASWGRLKAAYR
jgi:hypothetical protein